MSIDRVGPKASPAPPAPAVPPAGLERATETSRPFEVGGAATVAAPVPPVDASGVEPASSALERLRAGEVDLRGYVDLKVEEATAHLASLPAAELDAIRAALRDRLAGDPTLVDLVRAATGSVYEPSGEP